MAVWRTKAYILFGFAPGSYSKRQGVADLFADLREMAIGAAEEGNTELLRRICDYAAWADAQPNAGHLRSAADIAFFIPLVQHPRLLAAAREHLPPDLLAAKQTLAPNASGGLA